MGSSETYDNMDKQRLLKVIHVVKNEELMSDELSDVRVGMFAGNVGHVLFGTRLCVLLLVVPLAFFAKCFHFGT
ncbi:hypothetical protein Tco_0306621, partial [Tanacetum coccineum]